MPIINYNTNNHHSSISSSSSSSSSSTNEFSNKLRKLITGINNELQKRDWYDVDGGSDPARYAFFAFFVAAIVVFLVMICFINARRIKEGRTPMISSYLTPPSYHQSQIAYEGQTTTNLPTYTANPDVHQDVGYYDKNGNFIPTKTEVDEGVINFSSDDDTTNINNNNNNNGNTTTISNPFNNTYGNNNNNNNTEIPQSAHVESNINDAQLNDMTFKRPDGPPPTKTYNTNTNLNEGSSTKVDDPELPPYQPPESPTKSHYKS